MDRFNMTRQDYYYELLDNARSFIKDCNPGLRSYDISDDWASAQAIASVFGNDWRAHTIDEAVGVTMCSYVGHPHFETLSMARNIEEMIQVALWHGLFYKLEGLTIAVSCPRCHDWYCI